VNPAFDPLGTTGSAESSSSSGAPPGVTTTGVSPTTTGVVATSTDTSTDPVVETTSGSESSGGTSMGASSSSDEETTVGTKDCWDQGADGWQSGVKVEGLTGVGASSGTISPDGLTLHYVADIPRRLHRVERASRDVGFGGGEKIAAWDGLESFSPDHPAVTLDGAEIYYHYRQNNFDGMSLQVSLRNEFNPGDEYGPPTPALGVAPGTVPDEIPAVTKDGNILLVQRKDGPVTPGLIGKGWNFYQFERMAPMPGQAWVPIGVFTPMNPPLNLALCPALSPDGLHLLFTSTSVDDLGFGKVNEETGVWLAERGNVHEPWGAPVEVTALGKGDGVSCPRAVTEDGCTLVYDRFIFPSTYLGEWISDR